MSAAPVAALRGQQRTPGCEAAGTAVLQETVIDRVTRVPLRGAVIVVTLQGTEPVEALTASTDSVGRALLCVPAARAAEIRVSYRDLHSAAVPFPVPGAALQAHTTALDVPHVSVQGRVVDDATAAPVANATVRIAHSGMDALTGADGRFVLSRVPVGGHALHVQHPSYIAANARVEAEPNAAATIVRVTATAIPLAPLAATVVSRRLEAAGFYERQKRGVGSFIGRAQIDAARAPSAADLLRHVPGVRLVSVPGRRGGPRGFTTGRGNCRFRFVVDGTRVLADFEIDHVPASHIEGIEVYAGMAQVPAAFRAMTDATGSTCGVIALWMRDGR